MSNEFGLRLAELDRECRRAEKEFGMVSPQANAASAAWCKEWSRVLSDRATKRAEELAD